MIIHTTFAEFEAYWLAQGYTQCAERIWEANKITSPHTHPFDVKAQIQEGEFWLSVAGEEKHLRTGENFELARDTEHSERYGPEGAVIWVARREN